MSEALQTAEADHAPAVDPRRVWVPRAALAVAVGLLFALALGLRGPSQYGLGALLGSSAWAGFLEALGVGVALHYLVLRKRYDDKGPHYLLTLMIAAFVLNVGVGLKRGYEQQQMLIANEEMHAALEAMTQGREIPAMRARGDAGRMEAVFVDGWRHTLEDRAAYDAQMAAIGVHDAMAPAALAADPGLRRSAEKVAQARAALAAYKATHELHRAEKLKTIKKLWVSGWLKRAMLDQYFGSGAPATAEAVFRYESGVIETYARLIALLQHAEGGWRLQDGGLVFDDPADQAILDDCQRELDRLDAEREGVAEQSLAVATDMLERSGR